jgi:protein-S-isoprenylcysteine O-methyltransferase Ste14
MRHKLLSVIPAVHLIAAGLDRGRLHWTEISSPALSLLGFVVLIAALGLLVWAMHVNRFFSSVIRIQTERGHCVIDAGPYRWIRHPGYAAGLLLCLASGVALGSSISVAVLLPAVPLLLWRTVAEDKVLRAELAGYSAYASRVRYRLLPLVW